MENHWLFVFLLIFLRLTTAKIANISTPGIISTTEAESQKTVVTETEDPTVTPVPGLSTDTTANPDRSRKETAQKIVSTSNEIDATENSEVELNPDHKNDELLKADVALEHHFRHVLDQMRTAMKCGMYDGEALDPLKLEDMKLKPIVAGEVFDVSMQNITLSGLSEYRITQLESQIRESRMKLGLHYRKITANCMFNANGTIYDIFSVRGTGNATLVYNEVHAWTIIYFTRENGTLQILSADQPYVDFSSATITFKGSNEDGEEVRADNVATQLGPLYFWILTASAVEKVDYPLVLYLNDAMSKFVLPEILQKLSFRQKYLRIHVPSNPLPYAYVSPEMT